MSSILNIAGFRQLVIVFFGAVLVIALLALLPALPARADSSVDVTSTADIGDPTPLDTTCDTPNVPPSNGACTLRAAVQTARNLAGITTINLPAGTITIADTRTGGAPDNGQSGDFHIESSVILVGQGQGVTIVDGAQKDRVFEVNCYPDTGTGTVDATFQNLTIQNGDATADTDTDPADPNTTGGGIDSCGNSLTLTNVTLSHNHAREGGGIIAGKKGAALTGAITITNSTITGNTTTSTGQGAGFEFFGVSMITGTTISGNQASGNFGGGFLAGSGTMSHTTVSANTAATSGGGVVIFGNFTLDADTVSANTAGSTATANVGGGVVVAAEIPTTVLINNTTISGNTVGNPGSQGGGLFNEGGTVHFTSSTINGNGATAGGDIFNTGLVVATNGARVPFSGLVQPRQGIQTGPIDLKNTIVSNATSGTNCSGPQISSKGYNIDSATTCGFAGTGDQNSTDPLLAGLADNGGGLLTHLPKAGSPAIDKGSPDCPPTLLGSASATTDERGISRPQGSRCDVGAVEVVFVAAVQPLLPKAGAISTEQVPLGLLAAAALGALLLVSVAAGWVRKSIT